MNSKLLRYILLEERTRRRLFKLLDLSHRGMKEIVLLSPLTFEPLCPQTFMNWKFPSRLPPVLSEEINPDAWNEVLKEQVKSTYQYDYTGIPQGRKSYSFVID